MRLISWFFSLFCCSSFTTKWNNVVWPSLQTSFSKKSNKHLNSFKEVPVSSSEINQNFYSYWLLGELLIIIFHQFFSQFCCFAHFCRTVENFDHSSFREKIFTLTSTSLKRCFCFNLSNNFFLSNQSSRLANWYFQTNQITSFDWKQKDT